MSLARRRAEEQRLKVKVKKIIKLNSLDRNAEVSVKRVGTGFSVHNAKCSCYACGNPRKYFKNKTLGEVKAELDNADIRQLS